MRFYYIFLIIVAAACQSNNSPSGTDSADLPSELEPLYEEVINIHDEVMPEMSKVTQLQTQVTDRLKGQRAEQPINTEKLKETNQILGQLNRAESAMWDWMHNFGKLDSIPPSEKERFLQSEKLSAENMKNLVLESIKEATEFLEQTPQGE
ncbi:MAG: hypothetical protein HKN76_15550 [Saprospiraceae bacterium]|nr:hypothetical protein [Saprospiraceae bacterium]